MIIVHGSMHDWSNCHTKTICVGSFILIHNSSILSWVCLPHYHLRLFQFVLAWLCYWFYLVCVHPVSSLQPENNIDHLFIGNNHFVHYSASNLGASELLEDHATSLHCQGSALRVLQMPQLCFDLSRHLFQTIVSHVAWLAVKIMRFILWPSEANHNFIYLFSLVCCDLSMMFKI